MSLSESPAHNAGDGGPIRIDGELHIGNADDTRELFLTALAREEPAVLDFSGVTACDTAALQLICSLHTTAAARGRGLRLAGFSPAIENAAAELGVPIPGFRPEGGDSVF